MKANRAGRIGEDVIAAVLNTADMVYSRQVIIGRTIYHTDLRVDFVVHNLPEYPRGLVIESKWQDVGGSIDEKFPYLVYNILACEMPTIVIAHGGGCRPGAVEWLRNQCDGEILIAVLGLEEFISWAHRRNEVTR